MLAIAKGRCKFAHFTLLSAHATLHIALLCFLTIQNINVHDSDVLQVLFLVSVKIPIYVLFQGGPHKIIKLDLRGMEQLFHSLGLQKSNIVSCDGV